MTAFVGGPKDASPVQDGGQDVPIYDAEPEVVDWNGPDDPENPYNWSLRRKWMVTAVGILATFVVPMAGTMITVAADAINVEFGVSDAQFPHSYWPVASWTLGGAISVLAVLPVMEDFGVRPAFLTTYVVFTLFFIPQALARNFATLIITRFFAGGCSAILSNTAAAIIGNIWEGDRARTIPMSIFVTFYLMGASMGPVIGAVILENLSWRWISYLQLIWSALFFPVYIFFFQESRGTVILQKRARRLQRAGKPVRGPQDGHQMHIMRKMVLSTLRPIRMLFTEPVLFVFTLWSSFMVGLVYLFTQSVGIVFMGLYGWNMSQAGYVQAAIVIGMAIGWTGTLISSKFYFASASRNPELPGRPIPEARLYVSVFGSLVGCAGGMFVYGWTSYPSVPWIGPAIGLAMVGYGINVVVLAIADYVVDAYARFAGSAVAAVVLGENLFSSFLPLAAKSLYGNLGYHWASSLLGFLALGLSCAPVCILIWGPQIRARSPFMKEAMVEKRAESDISDV